MSKIMRAINHTMRVGQMVKAGDTQEFLQHLHKNSHEHSYANGDLIRLNSTEHDAKNINQTLLMERERNFSRAELKSTDYLNKSIAAQDIHDDLVNAGIMPHNLSENALNDLKSLKEYDAMFGGNEVSFAERLKNAAPNINADLEQGGYQTAHNSFDSEIRPSIVQSIAFGDGAAPEKKEPVSLKEVNKKLMQNENVKEAFSELSREQMRFDESMTLFGKLKGVVNNIKDKIVDKFSDRYDDIDMSKEGQEPGKSLPVESASPEKSSSTTNDVDNDIARGMSHSEKEEALTSFLDKDVDFNNSISEFLSEYNSNKYDDREVKIDEPEIRHDAPSM